MRGAEIGQKQMIRRSIGIVDGIITRDDGQLVLVTSHSLIHAHLTVPLPRHQRRVNLWT